MILQNKLLRNLNAFVIPIFATLIFLVACGKRGEEYGPGTYLPVSEKEAEIFAERLQESVDSANPAFLNDRYKIDAMLDRAFADKSTFPDPESGFRKALKNTLRPGDEIVSFLQDGGEFRIVNVRKSDDTYEIVARLTSDAAGLEYIVFSLAKIEESEQVIIRDRNFLSRNQWDSEHFRGIMEASKKAAEDGQDISANISDIGKIQQLNRAARFREAVKIYEGLPELVKELKSVQLAHLNSAMFTDQEAFSRALEDFTAAYPDDASMNFLILDPYFQAGEYDKTLRIIEKIENEVGREDAFLAEMKAAVYRAQGDLKAAEKAAGRAVLKEPGREDSRWLLLGIHSDQENFNLATEDLKVLKRDFGVDMSKIESDSSWADLANSKSYREWQN